MINIKTGEFKIDNDIIIKPNQSFSEIENIIAKNKIWDIKNGYKWVYFKNKNIANLYFNIGICFFNEKVEMIDFSFTYEQQENKNWNENDCLDQTDYYEKWLDEIIGKERIFNWGVIGSYFDSRGGSTSICMKYKK